jgi:hypothetical protein
MGYLLCDDLIWMSRVMGEAKALELKIVPARTVEQLLKAIITNGPRCVVLDLSQAETSKDVVGVIDQLKAAGIIRFVAYGSHLETQQLAAARAAGCQPVLARSKMVEELPIMLKDWLQ